MIFYDLHEWQHSALNPMRLAAQATVAAFQNPFFPLAYTELGRTIAEQAQLFAQEKTASPSTDTLDIKNTRLSGKIIEINEETIITTPFCSIVKFKKETTDTELLEKISDQPKLLIIVPLSGHHPKLLKPMIENLLPEVDVTLLHWKDAKKIPLLHRSFDMEDQISMIMDSLRHLGSGFHTLGVGLESVSLLCAVALMSEMQDPAAPLSVTLIGAAVAPLRARTTASEFARAHDLSWYKDHIIKTVPKEFEGAHRAIFPAELNLYGLFGMSKETTEKDKEKNFNHLIKGCGETAEAIKNFYSDYQKIYAIPAEYYLQLIERVYHNDDIARGTFRWKDRLVKLEAIKDTALLAIEGDLDDITAAGQTSAVLNLCANLDPRKKKTHLEIGVGHYGTFFGKAWRNNIMPLFLSFIHAHTPQKPTKEEEN